MKHFQNSPGSNRQNDHQNSLAKISGHMSRKKIYGTHTWEIQKYNIKFLCGKTLVT
jgi:hypothetical protein